ncbi:MAG: diphthamide synthesis protein, partial [Candidatus Woesearchaeota archaeon]
FEYGQTLGCDAPTLDVSKFDAFLYIGDGYFHPKGIVMNNTLPVYIYNPVEQKIALYDRSEVEWMLKRKKAGISSFLMYDCIGLLVSLKSGQNRYVLLDKLKKKFPDKQYYTFIFDSIDYSQLENFPFIQVWVNTACPRIGLDDTNKIVKPVVNIIDLLELKM